MTARARILPLALVLTAVVAGACKKKQPPATTPAPEPTPAPACGPACQDSIARDRAQRDSIAAAEARARDEAAARARALEAARASLTATIYFDYDASDIREDSRQALEQKVPILTANPSLRIRIAGHTDNRGSDEYNLALGQRRAAAAKRFLTDRGVDASRIDIVSLGEEQASDTGEGESAWSRNRRAEFEIISGGENIQVPR
jgi:peptidoglycan-associated lipoprotein